MSSKAERTATTVARPAANTRVLLACEACGFPLMIPKVENHSGVVTLREESISCVACGKPNLVSASFLAL
jgi:hypothetical protein